MGRVCRKRQIGLHICPVKTLLYFHGRKIGEVVYRQCSRIFERKKKGKAEICESHSGLTQMTVPRRQNFGHRNHAVDQKPSLFISLYQWSANSADSHDSHDNASSWPLCAQCSFLLPYDQGFMLIAIGVEELGMIGSGRKCDGG